MILQSINIIPLALDNPLVWGALLIATAAMFATKSVSITLFANRPKRKETWLAQLFLLLCPILTLLAGVVFWYRWEDPHFVPLMPSDNSATLVLVLGLSQLVVAAIVVRRLRPLSILEAFGVVFSIAWSAGCVFLSSMAVTGIWL